MEIKGELKLCAEGQRLFDYYCSLAEVVEYEILETGTASRTILMDKDEAWMNYEYHRGECDSCGYTY